MGTPQDNAQEKKGPSFFSKVPKSTLLNFVALICLFSVIVVFQRFGSKLIEKPTDGTGEQIVVEGSNDDVETSTSAATKEASPELVIVELEDPQAATARPKTKKAPARRSYSGRNELPVEELDNEHARQRYMAQNRKHFEESRRTTTRRGGTAKNVVSPYDDFIPYEDRSGK